MRKARVLSTPVQPQVKEAVHSDDEEEETPYLAIDGSPKSVGKERPSAFVDIVVAFAKDLVQR